MTETHPLAGLSYIATAHTSSPGWAEDLFSVRRREVRADGTSTVVDLGGTGAPAPVTDRVELIAEQGDALIFEAVAVGERRVIVVLTLHSASSGELFMTNGTDWVRSSVAVEALPAVAHDH
jgi:hypothetical protein